MMKSGRLRRVIVIQRSTKDISAAGTPDLLWRDHLTLRAEVISQTSEEFLGDQGARDEAAAVFRARYVKDVKTSDRVFFQGAGWNIREITEIGMQRGLELRCTRRQEES